MEYQEWEEVFCGQQLVTITSFGIINCANSQLINHLFLVIDSNITTNYSIAKEISINGIFYSWRYV